jgi:hypothetical protein
MNEKQEMIAKMAHALATGRGIPRRHYHVAFYDGGVLSDICGECGKDLRDDIHIRLTGHADDDWKDDATGTGN